MGYPKKFVVTMVAAVMSVGLAVQPAAAHDAVIGSTPADGETITAVPEAIVLEFSGIPKDGFNTIALTDLSGTTVVTGEPTIEDNKVTLDLAGQDLAEGTYTVGFQVTSEDGHSVRGKTTFTLELPVGQTATSQVAAAAPTSEENVSDLTDELADPASSLWGKVGAVVGLICILGALAALWLRRRAQ